MPANATIIYQPGNYALQEEVVYDEIADQLGAMVNEAQMVNLEIRLPNGQRTIKVLRRPSLTVGRSQEVDLAVPDQFTFVSRQHFQIQQLDDAYTVMDLGSTNGTFLNGERIKAQQTYPLQDRDSIRIGDPDLAIAVGFIFRDPRATVPKLGLRVAQPRFELGTLTRVTLGRDPNSAIHLDSPNIAWEQAVLTVTAQGVTLSALGDQVLVNGRYQAEVLLKADDRIEIGDFLLLFHGDALTLYNSRGYRLDLTGGFKEIKQGSETQRILDDINLSVLPHEFVALVGGSGAGKSTLMDGLNGFRPISGKLIVNNRDFYKHYDEFRPLLGYVPQYDILPRTLTVETALNFAAKLRLPIHLNKAERQRRISEALDIVEMNTEQLRRTRIGSLSGGQRKRVSIAAELLADPKLSFWMSRLPD